MHIYIILKMPNTKSAIRRVRGLKNKPRLIESEKASTRLLLNKLNFSKNNDKEKAKKNFSKFQSILMQVAKSGVISRNTAARKISRISKRISSK